LEKLTHPLVWPSELDPPEQLFAATAAKYSQPQEVSYWTQQQGLTEIEQWLVNGPMATRGRVLDVGCGAGREAIALAQLGYTVVGIDVSWGMVEAATRNAAARGLAIEFFTLAAHEVTRSLGEFDYVITTDSLYLYIPTRALRIQTLQALRRVLKPQGALFLSAPWMPIYRAGLRASLVDTIRRLRRRLPGPALLTEPGDQLVAFVSPVSDPSVKAFRHVFARREDIEEELHAAQLVGEPIADRLWTLRVDHA